MQVGGRGSGARWPGFCGVCGARGVHGAPWARATKNVKKPPESTVVESSTSTAPLIPSGPRDEFDMSV